MKKDQESNNKNQDARCHELFHILWTKAVGLQNYDKNEWKELQDILKEKNVIV